MKAESSRVLRLRIKLYRDIQLKLRCYHLMRLRTEKAEKYKFSFVFNESTKYYNNTI